MAAWLGPAITGVSTLIPLIAKLFEKKPKAGSTGIPGVERASNLSTPGENYQNQLFEGLSQSNPQAFKMIQDYLSGSPESMQRMSAPYMRHFNEQIIPGIAERFAGMGALSSSGFEQAGAQAGAGLEEGLASLFEKNRFKALDSQQKFGALGLGKDPFSLVNIGQGTSWSEALQPLAKFGQDIGTPMVIRQIMKLLEGNPMFNPETGQRNPGTFNMQNALKYMQ